MARARVFLAVGRSDATRARMHERLHGARHEAVVDEDVLLDVEGRVAALEIAGTIAADAGPERQILSARRRADRIGLHEAQRVDRPIERRRREQAAADGEAPEVS